MPQTLKYIHTC